MNLAIIGCGNIGLRHFQSLLNLNEKHSLFIVDNSSLSLNLCYEYYNNNKNTYLKISFLKNINQINENLDIIIISTGSFPRRHIVEEIFKNHSPKHIILEKFLFTNIEDYQYCSDLFKLNNSQGWVNQWMSNEFKALKKYFNNSKQIDLTINGNNWGMCCNSVHYIDWFHDLIGRENMKISQANLEDKIYESKRSNYYELFGSYKIVSESNHNLTLICNKTTAEVNVEKEVYISASNEEFNLQAKLTSKKLDCDIQGINGVISSQNIPISYQSERTSKIINSLINTDDCNLIKYDISVKHHLLVFDIFKEIFILNKYDLKDGLPIS